MRTLTRGSALAAVILPAHFDGVCTVRVEHYERIVTLGTSRVDSNQQCTRSAPEVDIGPNVDAFAHDLTRWLVNALRLGNKPLNDKAHH